MKLSLRQVVKRLGGREILGGLDLEIQKGEFFFILGPSGGGKTTLLRLLAGFLQPDSGEICFDGQIVNQVPPHLRQVALVFQQPALWPHLNVADNVGYGLEVRGIRGAERERRIAEVLALVRLEGWRAYFPGELSGGQQQRIALARALVIRPQILLLDEPLASLDPPLRRELREELRQIQAATGLTLVYVSHDRPDAFALAHRAAVLNGGRFEQVASPVTLFHRPASRFVAEFLGEMNWFPGEVRTQQGTELEVATEVGLLRAVMDTVPSGKKVWVGFRPRHLQPGVAAVNSFRVTLRRRWCAGEHDEWVMETAGGTTLKLHRSGPSELGSIGDPLPVAVDPRDLIVLARA